MPRVSRSDAEYEHSRNILRVGAGPELVQKRRCQNTGRDEGVRSRRRDGAGFGAGARVRRLQGLVGKSEGPALAPVELCADLVAFDARDDIGPCYLLSSFHQGSPTQGTERAPGLKAPPRRVRSSRPEILAVLGYDD